MSSPILATGTPVLTVHDNQGLTVRVLNWNHDSSENPLRLLVTQTQVDDASRVVSHRDPRLFVGWSADSTAPANLRAMPSLAGLLLRRESTDSGEQVMLSDAAGRPVWSQDGRGTVQTVAYDELGRPSSGSEQLSGSSEIRVSWRSEYGDSGPADDGSQGNNLRGVCVAQYDGGGLSEVNSVALSGAVLSQGQRFLASAEALPDWLEDEARREALLEAETYTTSVTADARGTVLKQTDAKDHLQAWRYNVSGAVCHQTVTPAGGETQTLLTDVSWSAAGQVLTESAGNGVTTTYSYDPQNQWLATITARRADNTTLQALSYGYDFTGNVTSLSDGSVASRCYRNQAISGTRLFTYDTLYQLLSATGRENANHTGMQYSGLPGVVPDDSQYVNYTRSYTYDDSGNLQTLKHTGAAGFTRTMTTESTSDRSVQQNDGGAQTPDEVAGWFDANGNLLTLQARAPVTDDNGFDPLVWDGNNNLHSVTVLSRSSGDNDREIYQYSGSRRVRRQTRTLVNSGSGLWSVDEVRYLPGLELRKSWQQTAGSSASPSLSEELHVITGQAGRAGIRVLHWETGKPQEIAANDQVRWSVDDNIGSLSLELDAEGQLISREEYYPFGGTAVWAGRNEVEASYKTVRYSGKERDSTGLYYYGHRYYAPWLCRWVSADPAGEVDGLNLYCMVRNNPISHYDRTGLDDDNNTDEDVGLLHNIALPDKWIIDPDSHRATLGASWGNVFTGLVGIEMDWNNVNAEGKPFTTATLYLAPYTHAKERPEWDPATVNDKTEYQYTTAKVAGHELSDTFAGGRIYHRERGPGHQQLRDWLVSKGIAPNGGFLGLSISFNNVEKTKYTSRSMNNEHFRKWIKDQDHSFDEYHKNNNGYYGPPELSDVTTSYSDGLIPQPFKEALDKTLEKLLTYKEFTQTKARILAKKIEKPKVVLPPPPPLPPAQVLPIKRGN